MANIGEEIVDGSVRWIVRDTRAEATTLSSGMMSAADKIKLNGYPSKTNGTTKYLREDGSWQAIAGYSLPKATTSALGGVMIGNNLSIDSNGKVSLSLSGNANHVLKGNGTWSAIESYSLPVASTSGIGGVKIGSNTGITIGSSGVISLTSASTTTIGGIKFPNTGTDHFLTANGTWATINTAAVASASNVFGVGSNGLVPSITSDQRDNLYYLSAAGWKSRTIPIPTQVGMPPFYDAFDTYTPSWTVNDTDAITFAVLDPDDKALIESYSGGKGKSQFAYDLLYNYHQRSLSNGWYGANLPVFYGSIDGSGGGAYGKQAGIYLYKVTPQLGYLWNNDTGHNTAVLRNLGLLGNSDSPKNTRMPLYAYFIIRKAKNTLTLGAKSQIVYYNNDPEILISTAAQKDKEDGGAGVANDSANVVFDYPQYPTLSDDGMSYSHPVPSTGELKDVLDSKIPTGPTGSDGNRFSELVAYINRDRLPWANLNAYWTLKHITSAETGLSCLKFKLLSRGSNSFARFNRYFSQIKINLISSETDNYMSQTTGLVIITKPDVKSFDYLNAADDYSTLEFTNSNSVKTLYFDYYSNQPLEYKITYTKVKDQNDTTFPVVKAQTLTDFCEETFKALRKDQQSAKLENNLDYVPTLPAYDGIELKDSDRDITITYKEDDETITKTLSAVGSLVRVAGGIDAAGTSFEEITGLYNGYGTTTDTDDSSKFVKLAIKAPDNKWYFVESEYIIKEQRYNTANRPINDKDYKRYTDNPYHPNYFMTDQFTVYRQFRKAIVFVTPLVSHGSCTLSLYTSTNDVYIPYTYTLSDGKKETRQKAYYTGTFKQKEFKLTSKINIVESSTKNICAGTEDSIITGVSDLTTIQADQIDKTTTPHNLSWLAAVAASGQAANYIKVGDYIAFKLQKTLKLEGTVLNDQGNPVQAEINKDTIQRAVVIGINHNPNCSKEGISQTGGVMNHNGIHFAVGRDGVDTAYHSMRMHKDDDSENNLNLGGWPQTSLRRWLNSYFVTDQVPNTVYEARGNADITADSDREYYGSRLGGDDKGYFLNLPTKLQQAIKRYTKPYFAYKGWKKTSTEVGYDRYASITSGSTTVVLHAAEIRDADPNTQNTNDPGYYKEESTFEDKIWLMSQNEVRGQYSTGQSSTYEYNNTIRYDYYKAANPLNRYMHTDTETTIDWWWRSINTDSYNNFRKLSNELSTSAKPKNLYGVVPCFVI